MWLHGRQLTLKRREQYEALQTLQTEMVTEEGKQNRNVRAGIEGTISQAVRGFGLRRARYRSLAKIRLEHLATAAAITVDRLFFYKQDREPAKTRISHFFSPGNAILNSATDRQQHPLSIRNLTSRYKRRLDTLECPILRSCLPIGYALCCGRRYGESETPIASAYTPF